jgi:hypothetical protein
MTPVDYASRVAALDAEAQALEAAHDIAVGRGLPATAKYHKQEAARVREQLERVRGEMLSHSAKMLDATERECLRACMALATRCIARHVADGSPIPPALDELQKLLLASLDG